jgi:hypothetical protein
MPHKRAVVTSGPPASGPKFEMGPPCATDADGFTETLTFKLAEVVALGLRVTEVGLKLQLTPDGAPPQAKLTVPGAEFIECSDKVKVADPPTLMTADAGETDAVTALKLKTAEA